MNPKLSNGVRVAVALCALMCFAVWQTSAVHAQKPNPAPTTLVVQPVAPVTTGNTAVVKGLLTLGSEQPLANQGVDLYIDDVRKQHVLSQADGSLIFNLKSDFTPGSHRLKLLFAGTQEYQPSAAAGILSVQAIGAAGLAITPAGPVIAGNSVNIVARLTDSRGVPIADQGVDMYVDEVRKQRVLSGSDGNLTFTVKGDLAVGVHKVKLIFGGTQDQAAVTALSDLVVQAPGAATLTIAPFDGLAAGDKATINLTMVDPHGNAAADQPIDLFLDGGRVRRTYTGLNGDVAFKLPADLEPGKHTFRAEFAGVQGLGAASANLTFNVRPPNLEIYTVPPLAGIKFKMGDRTFESGSDGVARVAIEKTGSYHLEVLNLNLERPDLRAQFSRWNDEVFDPGRDIQVSTAISMQVGFNISYQASQTFVDLDDQPVDPKRIKSITLKGSQGATFTFDDGDPKWLPASRIVRRQNGLESTNLLYSMVEVMAEGSNVVSKEQQRFFVNPNDVWQIKLLLYTVQVTAKDALFGFPSGTGLRLTYPNKQDIDFDLGSNGAITIRNLARGQYRFTITGASGIAPTTPADVSRDQVVPLLVISYLDIGVVTSVVAIVALGLIFVGRPHLLHMRVGRRRQPAAVAHIRQPQPDGEQPTSVPESMLQSE